MTIGCCFLATRNKACRSACCWRATSPRDDGSGVFPSYSELQGWLSDQPEGEKASRSTVSNALMMLRITRWLSLCQRLRDEQSGRITGNLYALHDAPLTHADACRMDSEYLALLTACSRHRNRRIRTIAIGLLLTLQQPVDSGRTCTESRLKTAPSFNRGLSKKCPSLQLRPSDVAGAGGRSEALRVHTGTDLNNKHQKSTPDLHWPVDNPFSASERRAAERAMRNLDPALCQLVLDDCLWRIAAHDIHRPLAYLLATLEKARRGEFNQLRRRRR
ncbi:hypothetical protein BvCmsOUNP023_01407 [Escherichia coli]|nr:hypothetical protein BvCmsOUNP023_01407 [Escherichia coli]